MTLLQTPTLLYRTFIKYKYIIRKQSSGALLNCDEIFIKFSKIELLKLSGYRASKCVIYCDSYLLFYLHKKKQESDVDDDEDDYGVVMMNDLFLIIHNNIVVCKTMWYGFNTSILSLERYLSLNLSLAVDRKDREIFRRIYYLYRSVVDLNT